MPSKDLQSKKKIEPQTPFWFFKEMLAELIDNTPDHPQGWSNKERLNLALWALFGDWSEKRKRGGQTKISALTINAIFQKLRENDIILLDKKEQDFLINQLVSKMKNKPKNVSSVAQYQRLLKNEIRERINNKDKICYEDTFMELFTPESILKMKEPVLPAATMRQLIPNWRKKYGKLLK